MTLLPLCCSLPKGSIICTDLLVAYRQAMMRGCTCSTQRLSEREAASRDCLAALRGPIREDSHPIVQRPEAHAKGGSITAWGVSFIWDMASKTRTFDAAGDCSVGGRQRASRHHAGRHVAV